MTPTTCTRRADGEGLVVELGWPAVEAVVIALERHRQRVAARVPDTRISERRAAGRALEQLLGDELATEQARRRSDAPQDDTEEGAP